METNLEFRKIPSLQFLYEVNCDGTIIRNVKSKRPLKCFIKRRNENDEKNTPYWCTQVNLKKKIRKVFIHNAVAECWIGPRPEGLEVDHIDRNSLNNHYSNLRYVTRSENMKNRDYDSFMDVLLKNLGVEKLPIMLVRNGRYFEFPSARKAAKFLHEVYPYKKKKSFQDKLYLRRRHIFDYDVIYLNVETGHGNQEKGKEQSTKLRIHCVS